MDLCLISRFFDLRNGGVGRYSMELANRLRQIRDIDIQTVDQEGGISFGGGMAKYFLFTMFESSLKIPKADIYHAMTPLEAIHAPSPLLVTFHDFIPMLHLNQVEGYYEGTFFERKFTSKYFELACLLAVRKADAITTISRQTQRELIEQFDVGEEDVEVIRHGINPNLEPEPKNDDVFRVGTLSFLGSRKRIDLLIKSFLEADVNGELAIAGKGDMKEDLKKMAGGDERVNFLGFVPEEDVEDFYNSLDVFVFPTKFEGYGLPAVEAMACKVPVVTLSDAVIPDDIKDRTIEVQNLEHWFESPSYGDIDLKENYEFAKKHDWEKCAEKHAKIYRNLYG